MSAPATHVAIVSGAAGAMGQAIIDTLLRSGYRVLGIDRVPAGLTPEAGTNDAGFIQADLATYGGVETAVTQVQNWTDKIDILVNCAGSFYTDAEIGENPDRLLGMLADNIASTAWCSFLMRPLLEKSSHGLVVNIASTDGVVASAGQHTEIGTSHDTLYAASKGGVIAFTRALAMCWAPLGIRVNAICPTITRTAMAAELLSIPGKEEELAGQIPLQRICEPNDIAAAVECLIPLHMTTGHILTVDGGYLCQ